MTQDWQLLHKGIANRKYFSLLKAECNSSPGVGCNEELLAKGAVWEGGEGELYSKDAGELPYPGDSEIHPLWSDL